MIVKIAPALLLISKISSFGLTNNGSCDLDKYFMPMIIPSLGMIYVSLQQITGHDSAVLDSYVEFVGMTAKGLEIEMARR